ncbi:hypothetical protein H2201_009335, partial [Coniosporium apollinis]
MGRSKTFDEYYTDFARCVAELDYSDDALINQLENGLTDELIRYTVGREKPSDYYDLV